MRFGRGVREIRSMKRKKINKLDGGVNLMKNAGNLNEMRKTTDNQQENRNVSPTAARN